MLICDWPTVDFEYMKKINKRSEEQLENDMIPPK